MKKTNTSPAMSSSSPSTDDPTSNPPLTLTETVSDAPPGSNIPITGDLALPTSSVIPDLANATIPVTNDLVKVTHRVTDELAAPKLQVTPHLASKIPTITTELANDVSNPSGSPPPAQGKQTVTAAMDVSPDTAACNSSSIPLVNGAKPTADTTDWSSDTPLVNTEFESMMKELQNLQFAVGSKRPRTSTSSAVTPLSASARLGKLERDYLNLHDFLNKFVKKTSKVIAGLNSHLSSQKAEIDAIKKHTSRKLPLPKSPGVATPKPTSTTKIASTPMTWAQRVVQTRPAMPNSLKPRVNEARNALRKIGVLNGPSKPDLKPVYFSGIPRCPVGQLRKALSTCLPNWSMLGISFIGSYACEFVCHAQYVDRLIATLKQFNYRHLPHYDPAVVKSTTLSPEKELYLLSKCHARWSVLTSKVSHPTAKEWYSTMAKNLFNAKLKNCELSKSTEASNRAESSSPPVTAPNDTVSSSMEDIHVSANPSFASDTSPIVSNGDQSTGQ